MTHLGDLIQQLRTEADLSIRGLSRLSGVDIASISRLENHQQHLLSRDNLAAVAQALGTSAEELERRAGLNGDAEPDDLMVRRRWPTLEEFLRRDRNLTEAQREVILAVYRSYTQPRGPRRGGR